MKKSMECIAYDRATSSRFTTDAGFLVARAHIASCGVQPYLRGELSTTDGKSIGGNPRDVVRLMRTPEEVFAPDAMASAESAPLTIGHPKGGVNAQNYKALNMGDVRDCKHEEGDLLGATTIAKAEDAIEAITKHGKTALSAGYSFTLDLTPGTHEGVAFDGYQRNIRINHVALVDVARGGHNCRVLDGEIQPLGDTHMVKKMLNSTIYEVEDGLAREIETLQAGVATATTKQVAADAARTEAEGKLATATAEIEKLKKATVGDDVIELRAIERATVLKAADALGVTVDGKGKTTKAMRQELLTALIAKDEGAKTVVAAVLGATKLEAADDVTLSTLVSALAASKPVRANAQDSTMAALVADSTQTTTVEATDGDGLAIKDGPVVVNGRKLVGRDAMIEKINNPGAGKR